MHATAPRIKWASMSCQKLETLTLPVTVTHPVLAPAYLRWSWLGVLELGEAIYNGEVSNDYRSETPRLHCGKPCACDARANIPRDAQKSPQRSAEGKVGGLSLILMRALVRAHRRHPPWV